MPAPIFSLPVTGTDPKATTIDDLEVAVNAATGENYTNIESHKADVANPHGVTATQIGLGQVDDTADADKPISAAAQTALDLVVSGPRDGFEGGYIPLFQDRDGRVVLGTDPASGAMVYPAWVVPETDNRDAGFYLWSIQDADGRAALGLDGAGQVFIRPNLSGVNAIEAARYRAPDQFSTSYLVMNIRDAGAYWLASRQDQDRMVYDVRKLDGGSGALIEHHEPLRFNPVMGQSNAGQGGATGVSFAEALYENCVMTFSHWNSAYGTALVDPALFVDVTAATDAGKDGQYPATLASFAYEWATREMSGRVTPGTLTFTCWEGSQPLSSFIRGTNNWINLMTSAAKAVEVAAKYGRGVDCPHLTFIQGEAGPSGTYGAELTAFAADVLPEIQTQMGLPYTPKLVVLQINAPDDSASATDVAQAQLDASIADASIILAGPMYSAPLGDVIHQSPIGRMVIGEVLAECHREIAETGSFDPLRPLTVTLVGSTITVTYGRDIEVDGDWVLTVADLGFEYYDDTATAAITSAVKSGAREVTIMLDAVPSGANQRLEYAVHNATTAVDGWANGRGLIYSPTKTPSLFNKLGFDVPAFTRHYCVRFTENL